MTIIQQSNNSMEETITNTESLVAHCLCVYHPTKAQLQIVDLFSSIESELPDSMLRDILAFAEKNHAKEIVAYCGPEPFNPGKSWTLAEEVKFYKSYGFEHISDICGVTPCMVKKLHDGGDLNHDNKHSIISD